MDFAITLVKQVILRVNFKIHQKLLVDFNVDIKRKYIDQHQFKLCNFADIYKCLNFWFSVDYL